MYPGPIKSTFCMTGCSMSGYTHSIESNPYIYIHLDWIFFKDKILKPLQIFITPYLSVWWSALSDMQLCQPRITFALARRGASDACELLCRPMETRPITLPPQLQLSSVMTGCSLLTPSSGHSSRILSRRNQGLWCDSPSSSVTTDIHLHSAINHASFFK